MRDKPAEVKKLSLDEKIQPLSSVILLRDAAGNEFKTSNSAVITSVIDEMKRTLDLKVREVEEQISL